MTYTEDRDTFERQLFRPPHAARMSEHAGHFVERLDKADKAALLEDALNRFWETRDQIRETRDILRTWIKALEFAARRRPRWCVWFNVYEKRWVKGSQLGRQT
ncbi:MAG: hypothetical protein KGL39_07165 [Patescibacteria group bacterium]|nr:hypothetical protein [Patescibacteria group bacterium]